MSHVVKSGPLFDGRTEKAIADATDDVEKQVATLGAALVRARMNSTFRRQTPFYRLKVQARPEAPGWKIWDQKVIYGWWLEGVGSRNRTTRFKGYFIFRTMAVEIQRRASDIGQRIVATYEGRMN